VHWPRPKTGRTTRGLGWWCWAVSQSIKMSIAPCVVLLHSVAHIGKKETMGRQIGVVLYVLALIVVVVGVDVLFLRHQFWPRLISNIGIVLVFVGFYLRFLKRP
jgi:hypothetical protein